MKIIIFLALLLSYINFSIAHKPSNYFNNYVTTIDNDNAALLSSKNQVTFTLLYSLKNCPKCRQSREMVNSVAKDLYGQVNFSGVDINDPFASNIIKTLNIDESTPLPRLVVSKPDNQYVTINDDQMTNAKTLKETCLIELSSRVAPNRITTKTYKKFAAKSTLPKVILFTAKKETSATWQSISLALEGIAEVAEIYKTERKIARKFDVDDFPSVVLIPAGAKASEYVTYSGAIKSNSLLAWVDQYTAAPHRVNLPVVSSDDCLMVQCLNEPGLCAILILPKFHDENNDPIHNGNTAMQVNTLASAVHLANSKSAGQSVTAIAMQPSTLLLQQFDLQEQEYPQLVIVSARKNVYLPLYGSFSHDSIVEWLTNVSQGKINTLPLTPLADKPLIDSEGRIGGIGAKTMVSINNEEDEVCVQLNNKYEEQNQRINSTPSPKPKKPSSNPNDILSADNGLPQWSAPQRPHGKRGDLVLINNKSTLDAELNRNIPIVLVLGFTDNSEDERAEIEQAARATNSMVVFLRVDDISLVNTNGINLSKGIYGLPSYVGSSITEGDITARLGLANEYKGELVENSISKWALILLDSIKVEVIEDVNALQTFMMSNVMAPRVLLVTDKKVPFLAKAIAAEFFEYAGIAVVRPFKEVMDQFQIPVAPALRFVKPVLKDMGNGQHSLSMELSGVPKEGIFYNNVARGLDSLAINRYPPTHQPKVQEQHKDEL